MAPVAPIVVAHASVGSGHRIAAEAIARELRATSPHPEKVEVIDALTMVRPQPDGDDLTATFTGPTAPLYDVLWHSSSLGVAARRLGTPLLSTAFRQFTAHLREVRPAAIVCTHALPALLAAWSVRKGWIDSAVFSVATDFGVHGLWPREHVTLFCVADDHSAEVLDRRGHDPAAVAVTGIPVRPQFGVEYDREASREHFGLPPERRIILAVAGSSQPGPYARFKEALATALPALASLPGTDVAVVTGRDDAYATELKSRASGFGVTTVHVMGFVEHMAPLMAACDLGLAKPGGLVCAESTAMGLPLVLVGPAVGQEKANAQALHAAGAALYAEDPRMLSEYVRKAATNSRRLAAMRDAAAGYGHPGAASDVARRVLEASGGRGA